MIFILIIVIALVAWSLHLMQEAFDQNEFSLMLAGTLVAMAAAAMMAVYFLMGDYMLYVHEMANRNLVDQTPELVNAIGIDPWSNLGAGGQAYMDFDPRSLDLEPYAILLP
jgi:hypothetical protein